jgi:hypothetical protein
VALFTNPQGHALLLYAIVEYLDDQDVERKDLARTFCPGTTEEPAAFRETIEVGRTLGVLDVARTVVVKRPIFKDQRVATLRRWVFTDADIAPELFSGRATGSTDLVRGLCWLLAQDPTDGPVGTNDFEERQRHLPAKAVQNPEQYRALARWACWLGLAAQVSRSNYRILPDLRQVVRGCLPDAPSTVPIVELELAVAAELPVADGGWIRRAYDAETGGRSSEEVSPAITMALEYLRAAGLIRPRVAEDAAIGGQEQRLLARSRQPVTDIEVLP